MRETDLLKRIVFFSHPSGMQLVNGIDPGVSKTQPLATFLHRSAVNVLLRSALPVGDLRSQEKLPRLATRHFLNTAFMHLSI